MTTFAPPAPNTLAPLTGAAWRTPWEIEIVVKVAAIVVVEGIVGIARTPAP